jgi:hypothetical protein
MEQKRGTRKPLGKPDFMIRLSLRQNVTWQGELHWLNAGRRVNFRSLMELISLMQEAADISAEPRKEYELRSWYDDAEITDDNDDNRPLTYVLKK